jgi:hypothetical protein
MTVVGVCELTGSNINFLNSELYFGLMVADASTRPVATHSGGRLSVMTESCGS